MTKMIYWDIDGVIRNLDVWGYEPFDWDETDEEGHDVFYFLRKDPSLFYRAKTFPYIEVAQKYEQEKGIIEFITHQPTDKGKRYTKLWIEDYFTSFKIHFVKSPEEKLGFITEGNFLVDDYPYFPSYKRIILIRRNYNTITSAPMIARNNLDLLHYINLVEKENL